MRTHRREPVISEFHVKHREDERTARRSHDDTVCLFGVGGGAGGYSRPCVCVNGNCIHSHVYLM